MNTEGKSTIKVTHKAARLITGKGGNATLYLTPRPAING